jgi:RHS repeat-associated protein
MLTQAEKGKIFRALHERPEAFIIPNPWDIGTSRLLAHLGFEALATTSAGYAFSMGKQDNTIGRDEISGTPAIAYSYDYSGRRYRRTVGTTNYDYIYDGQNLIGQRTTGVQDFVFGPGIDEPLATKIGSNIYYYSVDGLGSVALLTDTTGAVQNSYVYDAWGVTRSQSGSLANPFTYTSREANEAGMLYYRARFYYPNIDRFISEDTEKFYDGVNFYAYVQNNPINASDPTGKQTKIVASKSCCPVQEYFELIDYLWYNLVRINNMTKENPLGQPDYIRELSRLGPYAETHCGTFRYTSYYERYDNSGGCVQDCVRRHERIHFDRCTGKEKSMKEKQAEERETLQLSIDCALGYISIARSQFWGWFL